jgi:hypothetical protein
MCRVLQCKGVKVTQCMLFQIMRLETWKERWVGGSTTAHASASRSASVDTESEHDEPSDLQLHLNSESSSPEISPAARCFGETFDPSPGVWFLLPCPDSGCSCTTPVPLTGASSLVWWTLVRVPFSFSSVPCTIAARTCSLLPLFRLFWICSFTKLTYLMSVMVERVYSVGTRQQCALAYRVYFVRCK